MGISLGIIHPPPGDALYLPMVGNIPIEDFRQHYLIFHNFKKEFTRFYLLFRETRVFVFFFLNYGILLKNLEIVRSFLKLLSILKSKFTLI